MENQVNTKPGLKKPTPVFANFFLFNNNQAVPCYAILDSSCSDNLKCIADILQCKAGRTVELSFRDAFSEEFVSSNMVQLHIGTFNTASATFNLQSVYSVELLSFNAI